MSLKKPLAFALVLLATTVAARADFLWIEAEDAAQKKLIANPGLDASNPDELAGGKWICSWAHPATKDKPLEPTGVADYNVAIAAAGKYQLWVRAGVGTGLNYRVDGAGDPVAVDIKKPVGEQIPLAADGTPWWPPPIAWFHAGDVELTAGKHTITWYLGGVDETKDRWAGIDCFVLSTDPFKPRGKYKPDEKAPEPVVFGPDKVWDFTPAPDKYEEGALLDLRPMNEKVAGEHGFIKLSEDGNSFVRGDGQPMRFWASGMRNGPGADMKAYTPHAKFLAKRGVNIIRNFAMIWPVDEPGKPPHKFTDISEAELAGIFGEVAAMKAQGIYTILDAYWPVAAKIGKNWDVTSPGRDNPACLVFFDAKMQVGYKAWMKEMLTRVNPHTGLKLAEDPALAIIQLQNEDSPLFWDFMGVGGDAQKMILKQYADFLIKKYGSLEKTREAWKDYNPKGNELWIHPEWDKGLPGFCHPWDFTREGKIKKGPWPGFNEASSDQLEFIAGTMHKFNADMGKFLKEECGCKQLINANNWRGVDLAMVQDAEYWAGTANDVIARNCYTGGMHTGVEAGWRIMPGHYYSDRSMIKEPLALPTNIKQPQGHPFILPETLWTPPDLYQSEAAIMVAAQQALQGIGATCWFSNGVNPNWDMTGGLDWIYCTPMQIGQFPAAALMYRMGLVKQGEPAIVEQRAMADIWARKLPVITEEPGFDPNRDQGLIAPASAIKTSLDPLAFLVGPVRVIYGGDPAKTTAVDLSKYIDRDKKIVRSITGEIVTDYGRGLYTVNAPKAQAAAGFLAQAGPIKLADVDITCANKYATISVVAMDDKPIKESAKLLIQIGTTSRPKGWTAMPTRAQYEGKQIDCFRIVSIGGALLQVENTDATVAIANGTLTKATMLDANGMAASGGGGVPVKQADGKATIVLPANTMYVIVTK